MSWADTREVRLAVVRIFVVRATNPLTGTVVTLDLVADSVQDAITRARNAGLRDVFVSGHREIVLPNDGETV